MGQVKCTGPDCPLCKMFGEPDRVQFILEDKSKPFGDPDRFKWASMPRKQYDEIKELVEKSKEGGNV
jgi:hypothetical protein